MSDRRPAELFDPREFVRDEMDLCCVIETELPSRVREWLNDSDKPMDRIIAEKLALQFSTSTRIWLNLDASYQRWKETRDGE